ncbi:prenyl cysteine carboxyl methyltransferase [Apiospora kogelbergensis]|uniref:prenyl cysteine carboxyl methyltransferase n=1 Tax=Apiospora kogelbergensis TaxID=1337665 RepID=UPI003131B3B7
MFSTCSFALALGLAAYLSASCLRAPFRVRATRLWKQDRLGFLVDSQATTAAQGVLVATAAYHAAVALALTPRDTTAKLDAGVVHRLCPNAAHVSPRYLSWNAYTAACLVLVLCVGAPVRLAAYGGLGRNFTFRLARPDRLVTTGVYRHLQHPSYTGQLALLGDYGALLGCWLAPAGVAQWVLGGPSGVAIHLVGTAAILWKLWQRVQDEEAMLRATFGREWEDWHTKTKRFVPGVF